MISRAKSVSTFNQSKKKDHLVTLVTRKKN